MDQLLAAIVDDETARVRTFLAAEPGLALREVEAARLYQTGILHWLYAGDTALHLAAAGYRVGIMEALLAAGADANAVGRHRWGRPLHYAADGYVDGDGDGGTGRGRPGSLESAQVAAIRVLLAAGAELHAVDKNGATALHRAVRTRGAAAVACLLEAGADPARPNAAGSTPFHLAVQNTGRGGSGSAAAIEAQREIIREFLARGVSTALTDGRGKTVMDSARSSRVRELL